MSRICLQVDLAKTGLVEFYLEAGRSGALCENNINIFFSKL